MFLYALYDGKAVPGSLAGTLINRIGVREKSPAIIKHRGRFFVPDPYQGPEQRRYVLAASVAQSRWQEFDQDQDKGEQP